MRTQNWLGREEEGDGDKRECAEIIHIPALPPVQQQQAPPSSHTLTISHLCLAPSLTLLAGKEVPMVGMLLLPQGSLFKRKRNKPHKYLQF